MDPDATSPVSLHHYLAFGHRIRSTIRLPELRAAEAGPVHWDFRVVDEHPEMEDPELLGEEPIYGSVSARLFRHAAGYRILIDDTGAYDMLNGTRDIRWKPTTDPWWDFGRSHLIGRVLATSLQLSGVITLHASAVEMADGVVGFLAPKHFGKSTLAMMLFRAGARFVTDDSLAVESHEAVLALPGIQSLRVRAGDPDADLLVGEPVPESPGRDGKVFLPPFPADRVLNRASILSALYFLEPTKPGPEAEATERTRLPSVLATIRLLGHAKIGAMLGPSFARALMDDAGAVASHVPVFDLRVVRDLHRLPSVVDRLVGWHGIPAPHEPAPQN